jgi:parvulin-like peptidyl-prolyl isomerase
VSCWDTTAGAWQEKDRRESAKGSQIRFAELLVSDTAMITDAVAAEVAVSAWAQNRQRSSVSQCFKKDASSGIGGTTSAEDNGSNKIVAKVNGIPITEADVRFADSEIGRELTNLSPEVKRRALAEYLIDNILFADAAKAASLETEAEFEQQMQYLRRRVLREWYFNKHLNSSVSDADAKSIYDQKVAQLQPQEEISARHNLVDSEEKAKEIEAELAAGGDFVAFANEYSTPRIRAACSPTSEHQVEKGGNLCARENELRLAHHQAR